MVTKPQAVIQGFKALIITQHVYWAYRYKTASGNQASQHTLTITHQPTFDKRHAKYTLHHAPYKASAYHAKLTEVEVRELATKNNYAIFTKLLTIF